MFYKIGLGVNPDAVGQQSDVGALLSGWGHRISFFAPVDARAKGPSA